MSDELEQFGLTKKDLEDLEDLADRANTEETGEEGLAQLKALSPVLDDLEDDLDEGEGGEPSTLGKAAVAATLAATLLAPSAAMATEVVLDEPAAIIQTIDMNAPDDDPPQWTMSPTTASPSTTYANSSSEPLQACSPCCSPSWWPVPQACSTAWDPWVAVAQRPQPPMASR